LFSLFQISCSRESAWNIPPEKFFGSIKNLSGYAVMTFDDYGIYRPVSIVMNNHEVYVQNRDEEIVCVVNLPTKEKKTLLKRGGGPGEVLNITYISMSDDAVITAECNKRCIIEIPFDSKKAEFSSLPLDYGGYTSIVKGREGFITLGCFKDGRYMYYKPTENKTDFFGDYRVSSRYRHLDNFTKSLIYISSKIASKPDKSRFVAINFNNGVIDINKITTDSIINLKQLNFHYPDIYVEGSREDPYVSVRKSNKNGFLDVAASDQYIYTIYSGKSFNEAGLFFDHCEYLMVFDWDGNPVGCYRLNVPLYAICYHKQDNALYGIHIGDEAKLYKFNI
jgi:hypothetical protein